jgi:hypothetical protein
MIKKDIMILEEYVKCLKKRENFENFEDWYDVQEPVQLIENLIKAYRELQEKYDKLFDGYNKRVGEIIKLEQDIDELKTGKELIEFQEAQLKNYIEELKKYDYRIIKINKEAEIQSPSFTKEELNLMNLGIALYKNMDKLLECEDE